jgi:hypothetical protein
MKMKTAMPLPSSPEAEHASGVIAVTSIGDCVPATFSGVVTALYDRAVNVVVPPAEGGLVTLVRASFDGGPAGITLTAPEGFRFRDVGVAGGCRVRRLGGILCAGTLWLDTAGVSRRSSSLNGLCFNVVWQRAAAVLDTAVDAWRSYSAESREPRGAFARAAWRELCGHVVGLSAAMRADHRGAVRDGVRALVGLGEGATPAGDDALVGLMLASALVRGPGEPVAAERALFDAVRESAWRTPDLSRSYLLLATGGHFSAALLEVARALDALDHEGVRIAVRRAASVGHTSGTDGLLGLLCGLQAHTKTMLNSESLGGA